MVDFLLPCPVHQSEAVNRPLGLALPHPARTTTGRRFLSALVAWFMVKTEGKTMLTMELFVGKKKKLF